MWDAWFVSVWFCFVFESVAPAGSVFQVKKSSVFGKIFLAVGRKKVQDFGMIWQVSAFYPVPLRRKRFVAGTV